MARFEPLTTERLLIRNFAPADAEAFFAYKALPASTAFQFWRPKTLGEIEEFISRMQSVETDAAGEWLQLALCAREGGALVGDAGIHFVDKEQAEIGYTLSPAHRGRGYATEAVPAILGYLFEPLQKHRVSASVDPRNTPSAAVLERLGFRKEAHHMKSVWMDGRWCDDCVYAMIENEWGQ